MKEEPSAGGHQKLIQEILRYLVDHPDAKDTVEGILKWWLPEGQVGRGEEEVQEVLDFLVSKGWLTKREIAPSEKIYGVDKDHLDEIENFLRGFRKEKAMGGGNH